MTPADFPEANATFNRPAELEEAQCQALRAFGGHISGGPLDGAPIVVVAWKPSDFELARLAAGHPIFLSCVGGLPPHFLSTSFEEAVQPA